MFRGIKFSNFLNKRSFSTVSSESVRTTQLANGLKIITLNSSKPIASLGIFINAGSRFEDLHSTGASFYLKQLGFKSTKQRTPVAVVRDFELSNGTYTVANGREHMMYSSECRVEYVPNILNLLVDVAAPRILESEVKEELHSVEVLAAKETSNVKNVVVDALHQQAFRHRGVGRSIYITDEAAHHLSAPSLRAFIAKNYAVDRMSLVAVGGVEHEKIVEIATKAFGEKIATPSDILPEEQQAGAVGSYHTPTGSSQYVGGESIVESINLGDSVHFGIAFEGTSSKNLQDRLVSLVFKNLLGSAALSNWESVGSGVTGRVARLVDADSTNGITAVDSFSASYSDAGLVGVYVAANSTAAVNTVTQALKGLKSGLTAEEVSRAKAVTRGQVALEAGATNTTLMEFLGAEVSTGSAAHGPVDLVAAIEKISLQDVQTFAAKALSSQPTVVAIGNVAGFPSAAQIKASL